MDCEKLLKKAARLQLPKHYYRGVLLPDNFELPDNILLFFHDFPSGDQVHSRYAFIIPFKEMTYYCNGGAFQVERGMAVIHHPYETQSVAGPANDCRRLHITFELKLPQRWMPDAPVARLDNAAWRDLDAILRHYERREIPALAFVITELGRRLCAAVIAAAPRMPSELATAINSLSDPRRDRETRVKDMAARLDMSTSSLRMKFRAETGIAVGRFIRQKKFNCACHWLANSTKNITEVAGLSGYDTIYSFSRAFKRAFGVSPLEWRKQHTGGQRQTIYEQAGATPCGSPENTIPSSRGCE